MTSRGSFLSDSAGGTSRRAVLGALGSAPLLSKLPIGVLASSPTWDALVSAYHVACANALPYQKAFDAAERRAFSAQGPKRMAAQDEAQQAEEIYGRFLDTLEEAAQTLIEAPAPTIAAVIFKLQIAMHAGAYDELNTFLLADLRRLEVRYGRV